MKKIKILYLFLAISAVIPFFNLNLSAQTNEPSISEYQQYDNVVTNSSKELIDKADKYVILKNDKYIYIDNTVLTFLEAAEVKDMIDKANEMIERAKAENAFIIVKENFIRATKNKVSNQGYGFTGIDWYWWGARVWLNQDNAYQACREGAHIISYLLGLIPGIGEIVGMLADGIISFFCGVVIKNGIWIDINYVLGPTGSGWQ